MSHRAACTQTIEDCDFCLVESIGVMITETPDGLHHEVTRQPVYAGSEV